MEKKIITLENHILLSIIIPVYNTEKYLSECIQSCLNQNISSENYELILVDDGSTDNSIQIIKSFQKNYSNIVVLQKINGGVSSARNMGINNAKGEYMLFVDSDDMIAENSLKKIVSKLKIRNIEILILNSAIYDNQIKRKDLYIFPQELSDISFSGIELFKRGYQRGSVCGVLFKKQFIFDFELLFSEKVEIGEDSIFFALAFVYSSFVSHSNVDFYKVNVREGSASRSWNYSKIKHLLKSLDVINEYIEKNSFSKEQLSILSVRTYGIISKAIDNFFLTNNLKKYYEIKQIIKTNKLYPLKKYKSKIFRPQIYLLNFSFDLFCFFFLLRRVFKRLKVMEQ